MSAMSNSIDAPDQGDEIGRQPHSSLVEDGVQGCKRHLVEFIDQEDLNYRPIDKAARIAYVGESYAYDQRSKALNLEFF